MKTGIPLGSTYWRDVSVKVISPILALIHFVHWTAVSLEWNGDLQLGYEIIIQDACVMKK